jgi:hypothetical protein
LCGGWLAIGELDLQVSDSHFVEMVAPHARSDLASERGCACRNMEEDGLGIAGFKANSGRVKGVFDLFAICDD